MKTCLFTAVFMLAVLACASVSSSTLLAERAYQTQWCAKKGGVTEFTLPDRTRVDCVTDEYAVEVDFAIKWAEAVGQALYYSVRTEKKPGILLIMEQESDARYLDRLRAVTDRLGITVWTITPEEMGLESE